MNGFTVHGGRLAEACAHFGGAESDWIDLSTGINPCAWPGARKIVPDWQNLPDPGALLRLETAAAAYFGVDPALCCAVPGSEAGLRALGQLLGREDGLPVRHAELTYSTYAQAFEAPEADRAGPCVRVATNPNNPDGTLLERAQVLAQLAAQREEGGWLIVDEAFGDCHPGFSVADCVARDDRLVVTRSFGKFFGLAGLRLGFVLGPADLLGRLRRLMGDWPLCAAALSFGTAAYGDAAWIAQTRTALKDKSARLDRMLARHGLAAHGACPLFRLVETAQAADLFEELARAQILTRPFARHPGLLRLGLPAGDAEVARLDSVLAGRRAHG